MVSYLSIGFPNSTLSFGGKTHWCWRKRMKTIRFTKKKQEFQGTNSPKERSRALNRGSGATSAGKIPSGKIWEPNGSLKLGKSKSKNHYPLVMSK